MKTPLSVLLVVFSAAILSSVSSGNTWLIKPDGAFGAPNIKVEIDLRSVGDVTRMVRET